MRRICNFPIDGDKRCKQPIVDDRPNCGRHRCEVSARQLGRRPTIYEKDDELHVWSGKPDGLYCLIHNDPAYQVLCQLAGETLPCCLQESIEWRDRHGQLHRDDGPAAIWPNGNQAWYQHGQLHRDDGPAIIRPDGNQVWYQHGELHRDDGPAIDCPGQGQQFWYQHGELHRDGGPAEVYPGGTQYWYQHGDLHCDDGPAMVEPDGTRHWYWHGKHITEQEYADLQQSSSKLLP